MTYTDLSKWLFYVITAPFTAAVLLLICLTPRHWFGGHLSTAAEFEAWWYTISGEEFGIWE